MSVENAQYISQLDANLPTPTDVMAEADDHLRAIKRVLKATFPNLTGPVTASHLDIAFGGPVGLISDWYGASTAIPTGWALCDGRTVARTDGTGTIQTPDLRDRVRLGAGGSLATGVTGGSVSPTGTATGGAHAITGTTSTAGRHSHYARTGGTTLTEAQLPPHGHDVRGAQGGGPPDAVGAQPATYVAGNGFIRSQNTGGGQSHDHAIADDGDHAHTVNIVGGEHNHPVSITDGRPPFIALFAIMRV